MDYLVLFIITGGIVSLLCIVFMKEFTRFIEERSTILREFLKKNYGVFTLLFILIFFFEQLSLSILAFILDVSPLAQILIGIFSLIVLTTATIEKFILEKKYDYLRKESKELTLQNEIFFKEIKDLLSILKSKK